MLYGLKLYCKQTWLGWWWGGVSLSPRSPCMRQEAPTPAGPSAFLAPEDRIALEPKSQRPQLCLSPGTGLGCVYFSEMTGAGLAPALRPGCAGKGAEGWPQGCLGAMVVDTGEQAGTGGVVSALRAQGGQEGSGCRSVPDGGNSRVLAGLRCQLRTEALPGSSSSGGCLDRQEAVLYLMRLSQGPRAPGGHGHRWLPMRELPTLTRGQVPGWVPQDQWAAHVMLSQVPFEAESKVRGQSQHPLPHFDI